MIKKILFILILSCSVCFAGQEQMYHAMGGLTGGGDNALDAIPGEILADGNVCIAKDTSDFLYVYELDLDASATESSPGWINPDTNPSTKSWRLIKGPLEIDQTSIATDGTGEDNLNTTTVPEDMMQASDCIDVLGAGTISGANDAKVIKLHFGASSWTLISAAAGDETDWQVTAKICNTATNAQRISWVGLESDGTILQGYETASIDTTAAATTLKLTGTCSNAGDTITQTMWRAYLNP
jgi:hypothetical protein